MQTLKCDHVRSKGRLHGKRSIQMGLRLMRMIGNITPHGRWICNCDMALGGFHTYSTATVISSIC